MDRNQYRAALDRMELRADFRQDTIEKLTRATGQHHEREINFMRPKRTVKTALLAAALAAVLNVSAAAAILLTPRDVAERNDDGVLAAAFESEGAVRINESIESEGYTFTLAGLVSGAGISEFAQDVDTERTYVVAALSRTDGTPLEDYDSAITFTPLVAGCRPSQVNAWTMGGGYSAFLNGGVAYYLFDCDSLEIFADHTVYLAGGSDISPSSDIFTMAEDGTISFAEDFQGAHALFTLPLDAAKADPAAVEQFLAGGDTRD